jgi:hypothetical protein
LHWTKACAAVKIDFSIEKKAYMFISDFEVGIFELVARRTSSVVKLEVRDECLMVDQEKCTMQFALSVEKNVKYHSNQTQTDLYTAENVTLKEDRREEIDTKLKSF